MRNGRAPGPWSCFRRTGQLAAPLSSADDTPPAPGWRPDGAQHAGHGSLRINESEPPLPSGALAMLRSHCRCRDRSICVATTTGQRAPRVKYRSRDPGIDKPAHSDHSDQQARRLIADTAQSACSIRTSRCCTRAEAKRSSLMHHSALGTAHFRSDRDKPRCEPRAGRLSTREPRALRVCA